MRVGRLLAIFLVLVVFSGVAIAQKKERKGKASSDKGSVPLPDGQTIDLRISEMLAAWQIGDVEMLHKYYADDVTVVSGAWEPPLVGWANFAAAYQRQRQRIQAARLDRSNTSIQVDGNVAWAAYQWEFAADVDGKPTSAFGHTTLILEKRNGQWLIVHNHTSVVPEIKQAPPGPPTGEPQPAKPPSGAGRDGD